MRILLWVVLMAAFFGTGCQRPVKRLPAVWCPGKESIEEAVRTLELQRANLHPIRAAVQATLEWSEEDGRQKRESLDAQLRYVPTERLFLRGDKFGEIRFGTNAEAFWLMIKPELDTYWWGTRRAGEECGEALQFQPWHVAEALGAVEVDTSWTLSYEGGFDILTKTDAGGELRKRVWVRACDYAIERIEVYPAANEIVRVLLDRYEVTEQGYAVPSDIQVEHYRDTDMVGAMRLELNGIRYFETDAARMERLFARPSAENYEYVYQLTEDCDFIEVEESE